MTPSWWRTPGESSLQGERKKSANRAEKRAATRLGGRRQPGSGNTFAARGDIRLSDFLLDHKQTKHARFSITHEMWEKISEEARRAGKEAGLLVEFAGHRLIVIDEAVFQEMRIHNVGGP